MTSRISGHETEAAEMAGFSSVDEKGRVQLPKALRASLGIHAGSSLAYIMVDHAILLVPQDDALEQLQQRARVALTAAGLTSDDLLARLPQAREEVMQEAYGPQFVERLRSMRQASGAQSDTSASQEGQPEGQREQQGQGE